METGKKIHNLFVDAAVEVLNSFGEKNANREHSLEKNRYSIYGNIYAAMELKEDLNGWITISMSRDFATKLGVQLSGLPAEEFSPSEIDSIPGEMLNQIVGMVRTKLWPTETRYQIALPIINSGCKEPHPFPEQICWRHVAINSGEHSMLLQDSWKCEDPTVAILEAALSNALKNSSIV